MHTHAPTQAPAHTSIVYDPKTICTGQKTMEENSSTGVENMAGLLFRKKKCFKVGFEWVLRGFLSERKGMVIPCRGAENGHGIRTNSRQFDTRNLEAESIRSRLVSMRGYVKLKWTCTLLNLKVLFDVHQSSAASNMVTTFQAFCAEYHLWSSDWLRLLR